jgi:hypothetical protein
LGIRRKDIHGRAAIEFIDENGGGPGVRLRKTDEPFFAKRTQFPFEKS